MSAFTEDGEDSFRKHSGLTGTIGTRGGTTAIAPHAGVPLAPWTAQAWILVWKPAVTDPVGGVSSRRGKPLARLVNEETPLLIANGQISSRHLSLLLGRSSPIIDLGLLQV